MDKVDFEYSLNDKIYNETFAKVLLEKLFGYRFNPDVLCDRPDIWSTDGQYGIEVTTLNDTYYNTLKRYKRMWAKQGLTLEQIVKSQPSVLAGKLGINKHGNIILINTKGGKKSTSKNQQSIASTLALKLKKLQNYKIFPKNDLFIYATNFNASTTPSKIYSAISFMQKITGKNINSFNHKFNNVLVFTYNELIICPLTDVGVLQVINIDNDIRTFCDNITCKIVSKYYENKRKETTIKIKNTSKNKINNQQNKKVIYHDDFLERE